MLACTGPCASMPPQLGAKQIPSQSHMSCRLGRGFCRWHGICHGHVLVLAGILIIDSRLPMGARCMQQSAGRCSFNAGISCAAHYAAHLTSCMQLVRRRVLQSAAHARLLDLPLWAVYDVSPASTLGCGRLYETGLQSTFRRRYARWTVLSCFGRYAGLGGCWVW